MLAKSASYRKAAGATTDDYNIMQVWYGLKVVAHLDFFM
jgi:hypothetical protein